MVHDISARWRHLTFDLDLVTWPLTFPPELGLFHQICSRNCVHHFPLELNFDLWPFFLSFNIVTCTFHRWNSTAPLLHIMNWPYYTTTTDVANAVHWQLCFDWFVWRHVLRLTFVDIVLFEWHWLSIDVSHSVRQRRLFLMVFVDDEFFIVVVGTVYFDGRPLTMDNISEWPSLTMEVSCVAFVDNGCSEGGGGAQLCCLWYQLVAFDIQIIK